MRGKKESVKNKAWVAMEQPTDLRSFSIRKRANLAATLKGFSQ